MCGFLLQCSFSAFHAAFRFSTEGAASSAATMVLIFRLFLGRRISSALIGCGGDGFGRKIARDLSFPPAGGQIDQSGRIHDGQKHASESLARRLLLRRPMPARPCEKGSLRWRRRPVVRHKAPTIPRICQGPARDPKGNGGCVRGRPERAADRSACGGPSPSPHRTWAAS